MHSYLESDQLITSIPNVGPTVASLDLHQIEEIYEIRSMLEVSAVRSCAKSANQSVNDKLDNYCEKISNALKADNIKDALADTRKLYKTIFTRNR